jgi:predicted RNase H-like HicB family nuclease
MRFFSFEIVIEREAEDDGYSAYSPTLPGCFSNGKTIEEAKRIREAIQQHVEALLARGQPVPQNELAIDPQLRRSIKRVLAALRRAEAPVRRRRTG